uniref:Disease resistance protein At4g27190-like leucine-rich repeats domain-containing protein n=1 Tax=Hordeum vulgare subsp. vulgare TaxID=112509 RepID=A0A8I6YNC5_HORVV
MTRHFEKIIHVDCSLWKNRRTMQRAIAEALNLHHLMYTFDARDEEDDFRGVDDNSRAVINSVGSAINRCLINKRFLMIFHYGGDENIDLTESGVPFFGEGKLLWTKHGRFQFSRKELKVMSSSVNIRMYITPDQGIYIRPQVRALLHKEAAEVMGYTSMDEIKPSIVVDCFLYSLLLTKEVRGKSISVDYGWATHACNYWICDGILDGIVRAWEVGNALCGVIPPLGYFPDETAVLVSWLDRNKKPYEGWNSITSNKQAAQNISVVHVNATSYFLTFEGDSQPEELQNDMFQLASNLRVLKLCKCSFDFSSPPFRCCQNLRFLWLDHCTNTGKEHQEGACFPDLLVLDLRCTDYVLLPRMIELMTNLRELNTKGVSWRTISHAWKKLQNLHKLRLTEFSDVITVDNCSAIDMMNLELLDFSGNTHMESLPEMSSARSLKVLVVDGCSNLKHVSLEGVPSQLESFSFDGYGPAENWGHPIQLPRKESRPKSCVEPMEEAKVSRISLEGCARLHSIFLRALFNLKELDMSGTAIKTIDLGAMDVPRLKKLFLQGCEQLHSLVWDGLNPTLEVLHVDTNRGMTRSGFCCGEQRSVDFEACICFTDGRFLWLPIKALYARIRREDSRHTRRIFLSPREYAFSSGYSKVHLHISSSITKSIGEIPPSQEDHIPMVPFLHYKDVVVRAKDITCLSLVSDCQQLHPLDCHIEIGKGSHDLETMLMDSGSFSWCVRSMHVHDNSSVTTIPHTSADWGNLKWCRAERCPKMLALFTSGLQHFRSLRTLSASDLRMAYCILGRGLNNIGKYIFEALQYIYLHNCPRLVFVIPISTFTLPSLETLHIAYCSKLQHVFPLDDKHSEEIASGVTFNNLKHIKLYHLHSLEQICEARLTAPSLETISLRDCWGLRRLPAIGSKLPMVDCENDWWERLEWDGLEANHDPSLFQTRHSNYYKKTLPRVSVLR